MPRHGHALLSRARTGLVGAVLIAMLAGCSTNPATGRSQYILLPADQVAAMGEATKEEMIREFGGEVRSPELRAYVAGVGRRLASEVEPHYAGTPWEFFVLDSDVVNAFALPGGKVFITRGLLARFENEAQVAGVLGHEIGHVTGRHVDERLTLAYTAQTGLAVTGQYVESQALMQVASAGAGMWLAGWNRKQESESDSLALRYMTAAGYSPEGMVQVLEVLLAASAGRQQPEFLSTHPHPQTRIRAMRAAIAGQYGHTRGNPSFQLHAGRFARDALPHLR